MADNVTTRVTTYPMLDAEPPCLRVSWIAWDSGFRDSGLRIGDRVVAVNGAPIRKPDKPEELSRMLPRALGQYDEAATWAEAGLGEGAEVTLGVRRRQPAAGWETLMVKGTLQPERFHQNAEGRRALGPGGPDVLDNGGFAGRGWGGWYEQEIVPPFTAVLDGGWQRRSFNNRSELEQHLQRRARVEHLLQHHPGRFADALKADYEAVLACLEGPPVALDASALRYRRAEEERVQQVRAGAQAAWAAFQQAVAGSLIPPFPAVHPIRGDRATVVGKHVMLPPLRNRDWIGEAGHTWFVAGNERDGWYFADAEGPQAKMVLDALGRYRRLVAPNIDETYTLVGRVLPDPGLVVIGTAARFGLQLEIVAALIGDSLFVDLTKARDGAAPFAGEEAFDQPQGALPPDSAGPAEVLGCLITAVKEGDFKLWRALFATWAVDYLDDGRRLLSPYAPRVRDGDWETSRRLILGPVYDVRVAWIDEPRTIADGSAYPGAPRIEEVTAELDHVGRFGEEHRMFNDVRVSRTWALQRINGGPYRISTPQSI